MRRALYLLALFPLSAWSALDYQVDIAAPDSLKPLLENNLDLMQLRQDEALQDSDLQAMIASAPDEVKKLLETEGYFAANVTVQYDGHTVRVQVEPGEPVIVDDVNVTLQGPVRQEADYSHFIRTALEEWVLPIGGQFRQDDWDSSKKGVLRPMLLARFPLAQLVSARADIDPASRRAQLNVVIDSGPRINFGPLQISGAQRYPESVIRGQANFREGSPYLQADLLNYQASLERDSHYSNVVVAPLWEARQDDRVPIQVSVTEMQRQKLDTGLNYSTGEGAGVRLGYEHYNIFKRGYTGSVVYDWKKSRQQLDLGLGFPRTGSGYSHAINLSRHHTEADNTITDANEVGVFRIRQVGNIESRLGLEYLVEKEELAQTLTRDNTAVIVSYGWTQRAIDNALRPGRGYLIEAQLASTVGNVASDTRFSRGYLRLANYWTPSFLTRSTLVTRVEAGQGWAQDSSQVPASRLFKTGGVNSVRGYNYQSLGVSDAAGTVTGGRVLATASMEYQYAVTRDWRAALFYDAGDAANSWQDVRVAKGWGAGVRWLSPIAPLAFDIARGEREHRWRWNLNLGLAF
jgi:translocation and assembly module TamA